VKLKAEGSAFEYWLGPKPKSMEKIGVSWSVSVLLHKPKDSKKGERTEYNENQNVN
jgi:hypothetical protein